MRTLDFIEQETLRRDLPPFKVGDTVVFGQYAGSNKVEIDGEELIIMGESEIFAVVE